MSDVECRMSDFNSFNKSNVGFQQVGCRIFTSRMSDVGFLKSNVGWHLKASVIKATINYAMQQTAPVKP